MSMLQMYITKRTGDWDVMLLYVLYAYQKVPQKFMGLTPFNLLYVWKVKAPLDFVWDAGGVV